jgi:hypothetical protein
MKTNKMRVRMRMQMKKMKNEDKSEVASDAEEEDWWSGHGFIVHP